MPTNYSKLDVINLSTALTGHGITNDLSGSDQFVKKANLFYKRNYQKLMALFPFNFATDRLKLPQSESGKKYIYKYKLPEDALFAWEFYPDQYNYTDFGTYYDSYNAPNYLYSFLQGGAFYSENIGEIRSEVSVVDGVRTESGRFIYSNFGEMWLYYTRKEEFPPEQWTQQFAELMIDAIERDLAKSKQTDVDRLQLMYREHKENRESNLRDASIEDTKSRRIPEARIITRARNSRWR